MTRTTPTVKGTVTLASLVVVTDGNTSLVNVYIGEGHAAEDRQTDQLTDRQTSMQRTEVLRNRFTVLSSVLHFSP